MAGSPLGLGSERIFLRTEKSISKATGNGLWRKGRLAHGSADRMPVQLNDGETGGGGLFEE